MTNSGVSARAARKTTALVAAVLALIAAWQVYQGRQVAASMIGGSAGVLALIAIASTRAAIGFHTAWMKAAAALGWVNSRILLSLLFFLVITPTGLVRRMLGADPLDRRKPRRDSYWIPRSPTRQERRRFERLF